MAGRVQHADLEIAERQPVAFVEEHIKNLRAGGITGRAEQRHEGFLHLGDLGANAEFRAGEAAQVVSAGQVVGMRVGVENPVDAEAFFGGRSEHGVGRSCGQAAGIGVEVQHRINDRGAAGGGVPDQVGDRVGGRVEEGFEHRHGASPVTAETVIYKHLLI